MVNKEEIEKESIEECAIRYLNWLIVNSSIHNFNIPRDDYYKLRKFVEKIKAGVEVKEDGK